MSDDGSARCTFLGLDFDRLDAVSAAAHIMELSSEPGFSYVVTPNVDHVVQLDRLADPALASSYAHAALCLCDSRILARLARWSALDLPVVTGSDLTRDLLRDKLVAGKMAVVGGDPDLHRSLAARFGHFAWKFHRPPMGVRHSADARLAIAQFVEAAEADIVFFAIGAPQSEIVCAEILERGRARGVGLCIGASLEFLTGVKSRAPRWMQRAGLEWCFRLLSEPRRLWRRYLIEGPRIFLIWRRWINADRRRASSGSNPSGFA